MKFSTKSTYGLRAIIRLAENFGQNSLSLAKIAKEEDISLKYLERIFSGLKKAGLVRSEKGVAGGYVLVENPKKVNILKVVEALEGKNQPLHCFSGEKKVYCNPQCSCKVNFVLDRIQSAVNSSLKNIFLSDLIS